jgi:hypothetical protein
MDIDLADLREMHPRLPEDLALVMIGRAALSLQRNGHGSPVNLRLDVERAVTRGCSPGRVPIRASWISTTPSV